MTTVDFDDYSDDYAHYLRKQLRFFCWDDQYFAEYKVRIVRGRVRSEPKRILEYGCGVGRNLGFLHAFFGEAEICGCDIAERCLQKASEEHPYAHLYLIGRDTIPGDFDLILIANVFHHVPSRLQAAVMDTIGGLLAAGGEVFIFEHNPYNPATRHMVNTCPFDADAVLVAPKRLGALVRAKGLEVLAKQYALFLPPWLRKIQFLERYMGFMPFGGQYYIHAHKQ
jgi:SAM-dependent methyltransferase